MKMAILHARSRGAALMLALWALFLLSALIVAWALDIDSRLQLSGNANRTLDAVALACSGAEVALHEVALHPLIRPYSPNLHRNFGARGNYDVRITGEGGRLNLSWLLGGMLSENPVHREFLRRYLEIKGIDLNERDRMIDCLLDWVDSDNLVRLNGAEDEDNYHPPNTVMFARIDELKKVKGWQDFTSAPDWDNELTVNGQQKVDLNWISRDVMLALPGMTEGMVDRFLALRRGADGIDGTADDIQFKLEEARRALGFSTEQFQQLDNLVTVTSDTFRIVSVGKSGEANRTVQMIVRKSGNLQLVMWKEY